MGKEKIIKNKFMNILDKNTTTTVLGKVLTVGFIYDTVTSKWGCVAVNNEA
jgi:hypothetical protein